MRVVALVTTDKSDLFFANELSRRVELAGVIVETPRIDSGKPALFRMLRQLRQPHRIPVGLLRRLRFQWHRRFAVYHKEENKVDFGAAGKSLDLDTNVQTFFSSGPKGINDSACVEKLRDMDPDLVVVCGTSLLGPEILAIPPSGTLNLHGGLSQHYRGLFTTEFALFNGEPEFVGATVHYVSNGIDDGDIMYQGRPVIESGDNPHTLYVKIVKLGVDMMERAIADIRSGHAVPAKLPRLGNLYVRSMFNHGARNRAWERVEEGLLDDYLRDKERRDKPVVDSLINEYRL